VHHRKNLLNPKEEEQKINLKTMEKKNLHNSRVKINSNMAMDIGINKIKAEVGVEEIEVAEAVDKVEVKADLVNNRDRVDKISIKVHNRGVMVDIQIKLSCLFKMDQKKRKSLQEDVVFLLVTSHQTQLKKNSKICSNPLEKLTSAL
jgi:hypothetical protein